jgi:hypothetical protein
MFIQIFNTHFSFEFMCFFLFFFILEVIFFSSRTNIKKKIHHTNMVYLYPKYKWQYSIWKIIKIQNIIFKKITTILKKWTNQFKKLERGCYLN